MNERRPIRKDDTIGQFLDADFKELARASMRASNRLADSWCDMRQLLIEACGMLKVLDRHAKSEAVTEFLEKAEAVTQYKTPEELPN